MHHALEIEEILSNIFFYCSQPMQKPMPDLASLARTCRTFKEPALDLLWRELNDLSPLARCVPKASCKVHPGSVYSFSRPLTRLEWDTLRSYARRIWLISDFNAGLDWRSVATFLNPPTTDSLFPNIRYLRCVYAEKTAPWLELPLPSLTCLNVKFENHHLFRNSLNSFPNFSPDVAKLFIHVTGRKATWTKTEPSYIGRWKNLHSVFCSGVTLSLGDLIHLSHMPALTQLRIALSVALPASDSLLVFSKLHDLSLQSESLESISKLLLQTQLPTIKNFRGNIRSCPSSKDLAFLLACFPTTNTGHTLESLQLNQLHHYFSHALRSDAQVDVEDLRPCMAFSDLRCIELNIECNVVLTECQVLELASAWPKLEYLLINAEWGWNGTGGITPGGLVQLLETRPWLTRIALRMDTQGYTQVSQSHMSASFRLKSPRISIDVVDSVVEEESIPAVTSFFCGIAAACLETCFSLQAWNGTPMIDFPDMPDQTKHWGTIIRVVNDSIGQCSDSDD